MEFWPGKSLFNTRSTTMMDIIWVIIVPPQFGVIIPALTYSSNNGINQHKTCMTKRP